MACERCEVLSAPGRFATDLGCQGQFSGHSTCALSALCRFLPEFAAIGQAKPATQVHENRAHHDRFLDQCDDAHRAFALHALERIGFIHLADQPRPREGKDAFPSLATIRLDEESITYFQAISEEVGVPYQSLINL